MLQGIGLGHMLKLLPLHAEEGAAGAGQQNAPDLPPVAAAHETLKNCGMLGVHGHDLRAVLLRLGHHQLSGADQRFLVGKTDPLLCPDGSQRGLQAHHAHHSGDDAVHALQRCRADQSLFPPGNGNG